MPRITDRLSPRESRSGRVSGRSGDRGTRTARPCTCASAATRISRRTGNGSGAAPAASAIAPWRASSSFICSTMARLFWSPAGSCSRWPERWSSTCRSVSTTKPRLTWSPASPAATPIANEPAYHSGLSSDVRSLSSVEPRLRPGEVLLFLARGAREVGGDGRVARHQRLRGVERLRADFAGVVDAHQPGGVPALGVGQRSFGQRGAGDRARGRRVPGQRAQGAIEADDELVDHGGACQKECAVPSTKPFGLAPTATG